MDVAAISGSAFALSSFKQLEEDSTAMQNDKAISVLNNLIETCKDG